MDVSVIVNVTLRGAEPEAGTTVSVAFVMSSSGVVVPVTVTGTDWRTCPVLWSVIAAVYEPAVLYE